MAQQKGNSNCPRACNSSTWKCLSGYGSLLFLVSCLHPICCVPVRVAPFFHHLQQYTNLLITCVDFGPCSPKAPVYDGYTGTIRLCFARTPKCKVVVFVATCHGVDFLYAAITDTFPKTFKEKLIEHTVCKLHGDMEAGDRNRTFPLE